MLEKDIENLIASHPNEIFPGEGFKLIGQQIVVEGRRLDILFEDKLKRKVIVEVKRGILTREASGQIAEYYGLLKNRNLDENYELILCANVIPKERKTFLETIGIDCKELGVTIITDMAKKFDYAFIDDKSSYDISLNELKVVLPLHEYEISDNEDPTVWIFQGNPDRYDVLNALSDKEIGNSIHWLVNQHKQKIKKGHIALIWMSGKEAGIYAIARIDSDPRLIPEFSAERKYWIGTNENEVANRVRLTIIRRLINNPILKEKLLKISGLSQLSILRQFQGTNFPVKDSEWQIISQLT
jgi:hypothetical protein